MSLSVTMVAEVRPGVGVDTAGGFYKPGASGTDYSQQNSAQYALSGVTSSGAGNTVLTASAAADMVGNGINVVSGTNFNTGIYEIVSVSVGVSITCGTNAAGQSISSGVGATGVMNVGGALATVSKANGAAAAGNTIWIKASGTYTVTTAMTVTLDSSVLPGTPLSFIGYTTARGDNGQITWTTSTNSVNLVEFTAARNVVFQNIIFTTTAGTPGIGLYAKSSNNSFQVYVNNCKFSGFSIGIDGDWNLAFAFIDLVIANTRITACTSHGVRNSGSTNFIASVIDNNGGDGANWSSGTPAASAAWSIMSSIFYKNAANGVNVTFTFASQTTGPFLVALNSDFSSNTAGAGILTGNTSCPTVIASNNIFDANGTYGVDAASGNATPFLLFNNAFYNNTTAATRSTPAGPGQITLSANPYTSIGTDFSLNSTVGGGALCKGGGFPGVLQFGGTGHLDVGAIQSSGGGGGGGGLLVFGGMSGGITS